MKSDKEKIFENHIAAYLTNKHGYTALSAADFQNNGGLSGVEAHFIAAHLLEFI